MAKGKDGSSSRSHFWIDDLHVQPERNLAMRGDEEIKLENRMMQVLVELAENDGKPVSTGALLKEFWSDDDGNELTDENPVLKTISTLRKAIGDDRRNPRYIRTISKQGYCTIPKVRFAEGYRHTHGEFGTWNHGNPYVGLKPFDQRHAHVFQGRSVTVADLMQAMREQIDNQRRFVLIVGPSGCGKTSLIHASMIPTVTRSGGFRGLRALSVADCDMSTASEADPLTSLAAALAAWKVGGREVFSLFPREQLRKILAETPDKTSGIIEESFRKDPIRDIDKHSHAHLLLLIDHAETLVSAQNIGNEQRSAFARAIRALCDTPRILVIMISRLDFYPALADALPELAEHRSGHGHFEVSIPNEGELAKIIRKPAALAGVDFEEHPKTQVFLDDLLCKKAVAQPDALPLLQHTLHALYELRNEAGLLTYAAYEAIGGLEGAIARRAEEVFEDLKSTDGHHAEKALTRILSRLVVIQPDSGVVTAAPIIRRQLDPDAERMAQAFIDAHLFVSDLDGGQPIVKVAHEALLRQWPRAETWADGNRRILQSKARLQRSAARWDEEGRNSDHLLNPGVPLIEALEVQKRLGDQLTQAEKDYLRASDQTRKKKAMLKNIAIITTIILSIASTSLLVLANNAKNEAEANRQSTLILIDYLLVELAGQLRPQNNLELLGGISHETLRILGKRKIEDMSASELSKHSRSLNLLGEVSIKKGNNKEALEAFTAAMNAASRAVNLEKNSIEAINQYGQSSYWIGYHYYDRNEFKKAEGFWNEYLLASNKLLEIDGTNPNWIIEKSYAINNLGTLYTDLGDYKSALNLFEQSLLIKEIVARNKHSNGTSQIDLVDTLSWISKCHAFIGNLESSSQENEVIVMRLRDLIKNNQKAYAWKRRLANALVRSAEVESLRNNNEKARNYIHESIQILSDLIQINADDKEWQRDLAYAYMKAGDIDSQMSLKERALNNYSRANELINQLSISQSSKVEWIRLRSLIHVRHASTMVDSKKAFEISNNAINELNNLHKAYPSDYAGMIALSDALIITSGARINNGDTNSARDLIDRAISIIQDSRASPKDPRLKKILTMASILTTIPKK